MAASAKSSKWWACASGPWPFEPKISRLQHSVDCWGLLLCQVSNIFDQWFCFIVLTLYTPMHTPRHPPHTHIHTHSHHHDKVIAMSASAHITTSAPTKNPEETTLVRQQYELTSSPRVSLKSLTMAVMFSTIPFSETHLILMLSLT